MEAMQYAVVKQKATYALEGLSLAKGVYQQRLVSSERWLTLQQSPSALVQHRGMQGGQNYGHRRQLKCPGCHSQEGCISRAREGMVSSERWLTLLQSPSQGQRANEKQVCRFWVQCKKC